MISKRTKRSALLIGLLTVIAIGCYYFDHGIERGNVYPTKAPASALPGKSKSAGSKSGEASSIRNQGGDVITPTRATEFTIGADPANEAEERALDDRIRSRPSWKKDEQYATLHWSLRYADYINSLNLPDNIKNDVLRQIIELYMPYTQSEMRIMEANLKETLGDDNYAAYKIHQEDISQRSFDEQFVKAYLAARPNVSQDESNAVSEVMSRIQISKTLFPLLQQETPVTDAQIANLMNQYNATFTAATAATTLDREALTALKSAFQNHISDNIRRALEWKKSHPNTK